jgi:nitroimidazol reductase NimA-like FMN-containing flavoprotein (pyridoxamine 5'-phosphate oxidase superfamily)
MTRADALTLLRAERTGVVAARGSDGRPPLVVPVRHVVQTDGSIRLEGVSAVAAVQLLRAGGGATLCVRRSTAPHHYVSVGGSVVVATGRDRTAQVTLIPSVWFGT